MKYVINGKSVTREEWEASKVPGRLQEMLDAQQPPGVMGTDTQFLRNVSEQFADNPALGDYYAKVARAHGQDPKGKKYLSSLAAFPGDPRAFVDGMGDVRKVCEERGWDCQGDVKVKGERSEVGPYRVADDLVADRAMDLLESGAVSGVGDALETAREQLSPKPRPSVKDL